MLLKLFAAACCGVAVLAPFNADAQNFPNKLLRLITAEPGGGNELAARIISQELAAALGQSVIVDSRGGASGAFATAAVSKAPADGHTLLVYSSALWILPLIKDVPWDPIRDFAPIVRMATASNVLVVHPSLPVKTVRQLIALAKARPGDLNYASGGSGAAAHLSAELFKSMAGINIVRIPYKGTGPGVVALVGGEVQMMFPSTISAAPHIGTGKLRALAVSGLKPSSLAPQLPTISASGLPGYDSVSVYGIFAPAKTPAPVINRLNQEVMKIIRMPEVRDKFFKAGVETVGGTPQEFEDTIKTDIEKWGRLIKEAGIHEQ